MYVVYEHRRYWDYAGHKAQFARQSFYNSLLIKLLINNTLYIIALFVLSGEWNGGSADEPSITE